MYKIGICDDEKATCAQIEEILLNCSKMLEVKIEVDSWYSGESLCEYLNSENYLDILFLDIELPQLSGVDVGSFIRDDLDNSKTQIVFISSKMQYAMSLFEVQPLGFLIKPLEETKIEAILKKGLRILQKSNAYFEFKKGSSIFKREYDKIIYFSSDRKKIRIVSTDSEDEFYGKIKEIEKEIPSNFLTIHQSYIINTCYVKEYAYEVIKMTNNDILTISKLHQKEVKKKIVLRLGEEG